MKLHTFGALVVTGMTLTSVVVWTATDAKSSSTTSRNSLDTKLSEKATNTIATPVELPVAPESDKSVFTAGQTLMMEGRLGHAVVPAAKDSETYVYVDIKADSTKVAKVSSPLNLAIVIDRSGSMKGRRLQNAVDAARTMIERMRDGDMVSVLVYNTRTEVIVPTTAIDAASRQRAVAALRKIKARGDTCISCAVETGMRMLGQSVGMDNRILLLSDGEATAGIKQVAGFHTIADRCRRMGISISSIGVDVDYNERIMGALALKSNGRHYFAPTAASLPQIFDKEMKSLKQTLATNAELTVELAPGVVLDHVFDRTFRRQGNQVIVPFGSFTATDSKTLLMRVRVPRGQVGERPIADIQLAYSDLVKGSQGNCEGELGARASNDLAEISEIDGLVSARLSRTETGNILREANRLFSSGRHGEARGLLRKEKSKLERRRRASKKRAPRARGGDLDADFEFQGASLSAAQNAFDKAAEDPAPADNRAGRAQVRENQVNMNDMFE